MSTALISAVSSDTTAVTKTAARRSQPDTQAPDGDTGGFASVLAGQAPAPTPQQSAPSSADADATKGIDSAARRGSSDHSVSAKDAHDETTMRHGPSVERIGRHETGGAGPRASAKTAGQSGLGSSDGRPRDTQATGLAGLTPVDSMADMGDKDADISLPDRFSRIIAALPRHAGAAGKNGDVDATTASGTRTHVMESNAEHATTSRTVLGERSSNSPIWQHLTQLSRNSANSNGTDSANKPAAATQTRQRATPDFVAHATALAIESAPSSDDSSPWLTDIESGLAHADDARPYSNPNALSVTSLPGNSGITAAPDTTMTADVARPLVNSQWAPEFARQFASLLRHDAQGNQVAELRLDPPELGPLRVTINLNDSVVQATFSSSHAAVRNAVEQALPQLQQQLEQQGLSLGQTSVGHQGDAPAHFGDGHEQNGTARIPSQFATTSEAHGHIDTGPARPRTRLPDALVDTFA